MAFRILSFYVFIFMIYFCSIESSPLSGDVLVENYPSTDLVSASSNIIHPLSFISLICQQQEQYPLRLTKKLCSNSIHSYKGQEEQQRGKRVGWTISV